MRKQRVEAVVKELCSGTLCLEVAELALGAVHSQRVNGFLFLDCLSLVGKLGLRKSSSVIASSFSG